MTTLLLIRHGESVANAEGVFVGQTDVDLSPLGELQAQKTAEFVKENYKVDKVYASSLKRAYRTGKFVADALGLEVIEDTGLREIYAGSWEGKKFLDLHETDPEFSVWLKDIGSSCPTDGESIRELTERINKRMVEIAELDTGKTVVIATHATPIRCMMARWLGIGFSGMKEIPWVANASIVEVMYDDGIFMITKAPQSKHLGELKTEIPKNV